ncbi:hypothetical protein [Nocardia sp. NPDC020380]|uniref:hypothetical protein n=1 Tax=Nocardia sp. NPDC020380 TaxID=3364309 RepID=UPI003788D25D
MPATQPNRKFESRTMSEMAEDMEAAAIVAGDQSVAGPGRVFAAQRAMRAYELRASRPTA